MEVDLPVIDKVSKVLVANELWTCMTCAPGIVVVVILLEMEVGSEVPLDSGEPGWKLIQPHSHNQGPHHENCQQMLRSDSNSHPEIPLAKHCKTVLLSSSPRQEPNRPIVVLMFPEVYLMDIFQSI